ncbi:glycosyltransferase family 1 protein [Mycolicibacterium elephantis]
MPANIGAIPDTFLNGYFRVQSVTGQQRFATEIADRLPALLPGIVELKPSPRVHDSRVLQWVELQTRIPRLIRDRLLISLTARTPARVARHIVTIHDLFVLTHPEWYSRGYGTAHRQLLLHHVRHAEGIIVPSEPVRAAVSELVRPGTPIVIAPNAPSLEFLVSAPVITLPRARYFLVVASLDPRKNLRRLIQAYGLLAPDVRHNVPLLIVGESAAVFSHHGLSQANLPSGVKLLGRVPDRDLAALYRGATVFVSVSLDEGFGLPIVEAAQSIHGVLVVSDIPAHRWVIGSAPALYVDAMDVESISDGLRVALETTPDTDAVRGIARKFNWDKSAVAVAELAREILGA